MKFVFAFVFAAAVGGASAEFNLRAAISKLSGSSSSEPMDADVRVSIFGIVGDLNKEDVEIINESIEKSYNQVYSTVGYSMNSYQTEISTPAPGNLGWDPRCRLCPPDADTLASVEATAAESQLLLGKVQVSWDPFCRECPPDAAVKNLGDIHKTFENKFCTELRGSGSMVLADVHDCSFSFLDMPGQPEDNLPTGIQSSQDESTEVQLILQGTLGDFSKKDMEIIDESIVAAYNDAFASAGFKLDSVYSVADIDFPDNVSWDPRCRLCPPVNVDAVVKVGSSKLIVAIAAPIGWDPRCRLCPPVGEEEEAMVSSKFSDTQLAFMHTAFEKTLCIKLQKSGAVNLANVHSCSFRFVFAPIGEATTA